MQFIIRYVSWTFGLMLLGLSLFISLETLSRKIFNFSFQGADELGGYVLAICGSLAFTVALVERGHIRIDFLHEKLPALMQAALNVMAALCMLAFGVFFVRYCYPVIRDTLEYGSTAATPWATPLIYPQSLWFFALCAFFVTSVLWTGYALFLLFSGQIEKLNASFGPKGVSEELKEELADLEGR